MAASTRTYKKADGTTGTRVVGENGSSQDSGAVVLTDMNAAELKGQKARASSLPTALSTEDAQLLQDLIDAQPSNGTAITGESLESGGSGVLGWLSSVRKAITDRLPAALGAGGGVKIDGSGTALPISGSVTADTELTTADLDTGAGTDTRAVVGLAMAASGGAQLAPGDTANGLDVDVTRLPALVASSARIGKVTVRNAADSADIDPLSEGTAITGQSLETGGAGAFGWLSSVRKAITDRLPSALVGGRLDVNIGASTGLTVTDANLGTSSDAAATAGAAGTAIALLRAISRDVVANIVLKAGTAIIGKVGIDQTTPGTTDSVSLATGQGAGATIGATSDAAIITNATGTLSGKLRGLVAILADVWDSTNHRINIALGTRLDSTNDSVNIGKYFGDTPCKEFTIAASAVRSATVSFDIVKPQGAQGLIIWFDITAVPGTDTVTLSVVGRDSLTTSKTKTISSAPAANAAVTTAIYQIGPPGSGSGNYTTSASISLPLNVRITVTHSAGTNFTYAIGGCWV